MHANYSLSLSLYDREAMAAFSSWLCSSSTKNMVFRIVHPGGHVELHDRPVSAAEVMLRNPTSCVTHPHVFQQPWAVVDPDTMLMPGQNFYVVPVRTVRKLHRLSPKHSPSLVHEIRSAHKSSKGEEEEEHDVACPCNWLFMINKKNTTKRGYCFVCLLMGIKIKENGNGASGSSQETTWSNSNNIGSSEGKGVDKNIRTTDFTRNRIGRSPKRFPSLDHWQPSLESIHEE
jgi:hypothetical protein